MGSRMECLCGNLVYTNHFYRLIKDTDYDALEEPLDYEKLSDLFWHKGVTAYRCVSCGRLIVEWEDEEGPTFYLPEAKRAQASKAEPALAGIGLESDQGPEKEQGRASESMEEDQPDPRLRELEAEAEAAYNEMYDSSYPTGSYSRAKDAFYDAIALARRLGRQNDVERLEKRLQHIKDVFRHQFS